jgi:O-antigen ligase
MTVTLFQRRLHIPSWLLATGVIITLGLLSVLVGFAAGSGKLNLLALLLAPPLLGLGFAFISRYFQFLVLALPVTALTMPRIELPTGTESKLPWSMLLTLVLTILWCVTMYQRGWKLRPSLLNRPILALGAVFIISLVWGIIWRDPVLFSAPKFIVTQIGSLLTLLLSLSACLLIGNFFTTEGQLKYMTGLFIGFGFLMILAQLANVNQVLLNDRGLMSTWLIATTYGVLISLPKLGWHWRAALIIIILLTFYQTMVVNADWLSGWMPSVIAVVAITFLHSWKAFLALVMIGVVAVILSLGFFEQVAQDNVNDGSLERLEIWSQNWRVVQDHWLLGTGPAGYAIYYMTYFPTTARSTHNNYLDIVAQFGFVGMGVWLWLSVASVWEGWRLIHRTPPGFLRSLAIIATGGWIGAMGSMVFGDWVLPFAYNQGIAGFKYTVYSWLFLGTLMSIRHLLDTTGGDIA